MARVNVGIDPKYLSDQHLIAESVEITMITNSHIKRNFVIKSRIPCKFVMGTGHMTFFKNKIIYLKKRLEAVNNEMKRRGFNPGTRINLDDFPEEFLNDWTPTHEASNLIRNRVYDRLQTRTNGKPGSKYHRYRSKLIGEDIKEFGNKLKNSILYYV